MQSAFRRNGGSFIIRLYLSLYMRYFFCIAGSGELDAIFLAIAEVSTIGTLQYFLDLCLKIRYYY